MPSATMPASRCRPLTPGAGAHLDHRLGADCRGQESQRGGDPGARPGCSRGRLRAVGPRRRPRTRARTTRRRTGWRSPTLLPEGSLRTVPGHASRRSRLAEAVGNRQATESAAHETGPGSDYVGSDDASGRRRRQRWGIPTPATLEASCAAYPYRRGDPVDHRVRRRRLQSGRSGSPGPAAATTTAPAASSAGRVVGGRGLGSGTRNAASSASSAPRPAIGARASGGAVHHRAGQRPRQPRPVDDGAVGHPVRLPPGLRHPARLRRRRHPVASGLAKSWKVGADNVVTFTMVPDVTCSDGSRRSPRSVAADNITYVARPGQQVAAARGVRRPGHQGGRRRRQGHRDGDRAAAERLPAEQPGRACS